MQGWLKHAAAQAVVAGGVLLGAVHPGLAAGFALREGSADWMANAFAGDAAKGYDASTVWANPAGMVRLGQSEIDGSLNGIFPTITFSGQNTLGRATATQGTTGGNLIQAAATGGAFGVWALSPDIQLGLALTAPFGQRIANPTNFVGRYQSLVSSISDIAALAALSYRINDQVSIGGGPVIDYFTARLTQAINTGPTAGLTGDPTGDLRGGDLSGGFNLGALYQPTPDLRFGLDYRSRIQHGITAKQTIAIPALIQALSPGAAAFLAASNTAARTKVTLPDIATGSAYWQVTADLALLATLEWTDWSVLRSINVTPVPPPGQGIPVPGTVLQESWRNTWFASIGANEAITDKILLQGGVGYDQSPVRASTRTTRIPDADRVTLAAGIQYAILPNLTLQLAYAHLFFTGASIRNAASPTAGVISGSYAASADTASIGARLRF